MKQHYYGLTAEGPNSKDGFEYVYLGYFDDFDTAVDAADNLSFSVIWVSPRSELKGLERNIHAVLEAT